MNGSGSLAAPCGYRSERSGPRLRWLGPFRPTTVPALAASCQNGNLRFRPQANLAPERTRSVSKNRLKVVRSTRASTTTVSSRIRPSSGLPGRWRHQLHAIWMKRVGNHCGPSQGPWRCRTGGPARSPVIHLAGDKNEQLTVKRFVPRAGRSDFRVPRQLQYHAVRGRRRGPSSEIGR